MAHAEDSSAAPSPERSPPAAPDHQWQPRPGQPPAVLPPWWPLALLAVAVAMAVGR
jgi:hypothetical protein